MNKFLYTLIAAVGLSLFTGCSYEDDISEPNYVTFESESKAISVVDTESETLEVTIYTGNITGADRTFEIIVDETSTLDASTYTLPETVTVPANSNEGTFSVEIQGSGIDNEGDVLVLELPEDAELSAGDPLTISVLKICPFDASGWVGTYDVEEVFTGGQNEGLSLAAAFGESYQIEMEADPSDSGSVILQNSDGFDQYFVDGTVLTFGACGGTVSLSSRDIAAGFGNLTMTSSSFDSETKTITVNGTLGNFGPYRYILTPQGDGDGEDDDTDTDA